MTPPTDAVARTLPAELDLAAAEALRAMLVQALDGDQPLTLDGSAIERVSTACLQVLVAAARAAVEEGKPFRIADPSPVLRNAIEDLALHSLLPMEA